MINPWSQSFLLTREQMEMIYLFRLARILRDSWIWIPCNAVMSDADYAVMEKAVLAAKDGEGLHSLNHLLFRKRCLTVLLIWNRVWKGREN